VPTINGILFRKADHYTARDAQKGDTDAHGDPIAPGRKVIVSKKECQETEDGLDPTTADPIPQIHATDYRAYGLWRKQENRERRIDGELCRGYWTCPVYRVVGSEVQQGSIYAKTDPRKSILRSLQKEALKDPQSEDEAAVA